MAEEFENADNVSNIDEDELITSDIEDNEVDDVVDNKDDDDDMDKDDDIDKEEDDDVIPVTKKKIHHIKFKSHDNDNKLIVVKPENRITSDHMTLYEYTSVVGTRATHISNGAPIYTSYDNLSDPIDIAKKEINENKCPLSVVRKLGNSNKIEIWEVNELIKPNI